VTPPVLVWSAVEDAWGHLVFDGPCGPRFNAQSRRVAGRFVRDADLTLLLDWADAEFAGDPSLYDTAVGG
jgi:hypothetical protein